jgi:hypothetical protein
MKIHVVYNVRCSSPAQVLAQNLAGEPMFAIVLGSPPDLAAILVCQECFQPWAIPGPTD